MQYYNIISNYYLIKYIKKIWTLIYKLIGSLLGSHFYENYLIFIIEF